MSLMNRDVRLWNVAYSVAETSTCRYRFGAVIASGNTIISAGCNVLKSHPVFQHYGEYCISVHAEIRAIIRAKRDCSGMSMYVARSNSLSKASFPCQCCLELIRESGIKYIVYHNGDYIEKAIL